MAKILLIFPFISLPAVLGILYENEGIHYQEVVFLCSLWAHHLNARKHEKQNTFEVKYMFPLTYVFKQNFTDLNLCEFTPFLLCNLRQLSVVLINDGFIANRYEAVRKIGISVFREKAAGIWWRHHIWQNSNVSSKERDRIMLILIILDVCGFFCEICTDIMHFFSLSSSSWSSFSPISSLLLSSLSSSLSSLSSF